ncbi:MAG: TolC family protein, partial [Deferribacterales bacterium]
MRLKQYLYCAFFIFPLSLSAEMKTITLSEAIEKGLSNNYYIKAEENSVNSKLHLIDSAKYGDYPSIIFDYKYTVMDKEKKLKMSMGGIPMNIVQVERNYSNLNLGINYILYAGGAIEANKNIAKSIFNSSKHSLEELKNSIKLKIQESYINILELKALREVIIAQINRLKSHSNDIEALYNE